jgi:hypothetical protein
LIFVHFVSLGEVAADLMQDVKPMTDYEKLAADVDSLLEEMEKINELLNVPNSAFLYASNWRMYTPKFLAPNFIGTLRKQRLTYDVLSEEFESTYINQTVNKTIQFIFAAFV